jgi:hypothetical protein
MNIWQTRNAFWITPGLSKEMQTLHLLAVDTGGIRPLKFTRYEYLIYISGTAPGFPVPAGKGNHVASCPRNSTT